MRIKDATVDWNEGSSLDPTLQVLVDEIPDRSELRFQNEDELWVGIDNGYVEYFAYSGDGNDGGYSGRCFEVTMADGEQVTLKGPWSSRAGIVNKSRFGPVVDVRITDNPAVLDKGFTFTSGALTLAAAKQAIDFVDEASHLERVIKFSGDEPYWRPVRDSVGEA